MTLLEWYISFGGALFVAAFAATRGRESLMLIAVGVALGLVIALIAFAT